MVEKSESEPYLETRQCEPFAEAHPRPIAEGQDVFESLYFFESVLRIEGVAEPTIRIKLFRCRSPEYLCAINITDGDA